MFSPHYEKFQMYSYNCGSRKIFSRAYNRAAAPTKTECTVHVNNQVKKKKKNHQRRGSKKCGSICVHYHCHTIHLTRNALSAKEHREH